MKRTQIINALIEKYQYNSYLEIGTYDPALNFNHINARHKVSVEPFPLPGTNISFIGTSDEYFTSINADVKFDIVFIDGLHLHEQLTLDIENSLRHLSTKGIIVCHDCLPTSEAMQTREDSGEQWTGDVWKSIAKLMVSSSDLEISVVDTDFGCALIRPGKNIPYQTNGNDYLSFEYYSKHKEHLMNVISKVTFWRHYLRADPALFFKLRIHRILLSQLKKKLIN